MKISVVIDNISAHGLPTEHGLCLWVEACGHRFFFDLGQGSLFADNAATMGIAPRNAEFAVISHGHYDHGGGIETFLNLNSTAPVYIHEAAFGKYFSLSAGRPKYIGLTPRLLDDSRIRTTTGVVDIAEGLTLFSGCKGREFFSPSNSRIMKSVGNHLVCDDFIHEQSLVIREDNVNLLIAGCAHSGILNIMAKAEQTTGCRITHVVAGMHLIGMDNHRFVDGLAQALKQTGSMFYTCHCTGTEAFELMNSVMRHQIAYASAGDTILL